MPRLLIYIPFTRAAIGGAPGDLRTNAADLVAQTGVPCVINNTAITQIIAVFRGEEAANQVQAGDILVVHAHGGAKDGGMTDNLGQNVNLNGVLQNLVLLNAQNAGSAFFLVCFSAAVGHIAPVWAAGHPGIPTFGAPGIVQGAIAQITRQGTIRNAMFFVGDPRIHQAQ